MSAGRFIWLAIVAVLVSVASGSAHAQEKRIALLIGNQAYKPGVGALVNPLNDVRIVGDALKSVGFEVMTPVANGTRDSILLAVHDFAAKLKDAGRDAVGFLYYSGHGIASGSDNFMIPVDVDEPSTRLLSVRGVKHTEVLSILRGEAPNAAHYIVLDACRNNLQGARGGKGFVPVGQQSGVLFAFSAEPGKTASDTGQGSGPYAAALAAELKKPGQSDLVMFHNVRVAVTDKTGGDQVPWTEDGIQRRERVMFGGVVAPVPSAAVRPPMSEAAQAWAATKDSTSVNVLEAFERQYPNTVFAAMARTRIEELKKAGSDTSLGWLWSSPLSGAAQSQGPPVQTAIVTPQPSPTPAPPPAANSMAAANAIDASPLWMFIRAEFPEWHAERQREAQKLRSEKKDDPVVLRYLMAQLVQLRRNHADDALGASPAAIKTVSELFVVNMLELTRQSVDACYSYISHGEASNALFPLYGDKALSDLIEKQLLAVFTAIAKGRKARQPLVPPRKSDYELLARELVRRGWTDADLQLFSDPRALGWASPVVVCKLVREWSEAQLALDDPAAQTRLLVESLRPVVGG